MDREDREALFVIAERGGLNATKGFLEKIRELNRRDFVSDTLLENEISHLIRTGELPTREGN